MFTGIHCIAPDKQTLVLYRKTKQTALSETVISVQATFREGDSGLAGRRDATCNYQDPTIV